MARPCGHAKQVEDCPACRWCVMPGETARAYRQSWGEPEPKRLMEERRPSSACVHLGAETRRQLCPSCRGHVELKVFACAVHGECTQGKPAAGVKGCCQGCADKQINRTPRVQAAGEIRHLLYHIYPKGPVWRWNVEKLKRRLSLFNGRRVIGVAVGDGSEPASAVRKALTGYGCEFIETANVVDRREGSTYHALHERVAEFTGPEHVTLYAHAKGVTSENWGVGVRRWTEALYETCMDHWPAVRRLLRDHPIAGPFKRLGYCFAREKNGFQSRSDWHYSGSWRWFRNKDLFSRNWRELEPFWCCVESQPSLIFRLDEAANIACAVRTGGLALYTDDYWKEHAGPAMAQWREERLHDRQPPLLLTCLLISHQKPRWVHEAIQSVLTQTSADWNLVIVDSGSLIEELRRYESDARVRIVESSDGPRCQGWQTNEAVRRGWIVGDLVHCMTDDDKLDPDAFAAWLRAARFAPDQSAWFGQANRTETVPGGEVPLGVLDAAPGARLNGRIDGIQVCCRRELFGRCPWPEEEDRETRGHADGIYLDRLQAAGTVHRLDVKVGTHRHTPDSVFTQKA